MNEAEFAAAGLLDGLEGAERNARLTLLQRLRDDGCTLDELRDAAATGRLPLVPVERLLARRRRHSIRTAIETAAITEAFAVRNHRTIGLPLPDVDDFAAAMLPVVDRITGAVLRLHRSTWCRARPSQGWRARRWERAR